MTNNDIFQIYKKTIILINEEIYARYKRFY